MQIFLLVSLILNTFPLMVFFLLKVIEGSKSKIGHNGEHHQHWNHLFCSNPQNKRYFGFWSIQILQMSVFRLDLVPFLSIPLLLLPSVFLGSEQNNLNKRNQLAKYQPDVNHLHVGGGG